MQHATTLDHSYPQNTVLLTPTYSIHFTSGLECCKRVLFNKQNSSAAYSERLAQPIERGNVQPMPTRPSFHQSLKALSNGRVIVKWYPKGGVGKTTNVVILALLLAKASLKILVVDTDPECGASRDFLGESLDGLTSNLKTYLEDHVQLELPIVPSGVEGIDLVPCAPEQHRFFCLFEEDSPRLRQGIDLARSQYDLILIDGPNQLVNIAQLALYAADAVVLPIELSSDCLDRVPLALRRLEQARAFNPTLEVLGALPLANRRCAGRNQGISAKEHLVLEQYHTVLAKAGITPFQTIMFRSAGTVEEARSCAEDRLLHWTARRRFHHYLTEIITRWKTSSLSHSSHERSQARPTRTTLTKAA